MLAVRGPYIEGCGLCGNGIPGHDQLVIHAIELHMLESPPFINTAGDYFLAQTGEIWGVEHAYFYSLWSEFRYQRGKERGT